MAMMTRSTKWFFANMMIGTAIFTYGRIAFQEPIDRPTLGHFAMNYGNVEVSSPWQRLKTAELACLENRAYRNVPVREDGESAAIEESCYGDNVLRLYKQGGRLSPLQSAVAKAAREYNEQLKYYYMGYFFWFMGSIPIFHNLYKRFWRRFGKPLTWLAKLIARYARKFSEALLKKMDA